MAKGYRKGHYYVICDRTGRRMWDDEVKREWTGAIVGSQYYEDRNQQDFLRSRPEGRPPPFTRPYPPDQFIALKQYGYDYGAHWNFAPNLPADLITNYTYDVPANDPVTGTADSFFTTTGDAKWYRNGNGLLVQGAANAMVREFDTVGNFLGWLYEPATKTNRMLRSRDWSNLAVWGPLNSDIVASSALVPYASGSTTFQKLVERVGTAVHRTRQTSTGHTAGAVVTASCLAKPAERTIVSIRILDSIGSDGGQATFNLLTGVATVVTTFGAGTQLSAYMERFAYGTWRCFLTAKPNGVTTSFIVDYFLLDANGTASYAGDGVSGAYFADAQIEEGPVGTSIIPTLGAAVARATDRAYLVPGAWFNKSLGTIYAKFRLGVGNKAANQFIVDFTDNSFVNSITLLSSSAGLGSMSVNKASGFAGLAAMPPPALADRTNIRLIGAYAENYVRVALNGTLGNRDNAAPMPTATLTRMDIGTDQDGSDNCHSLWLQSLDIWPEAYTEAQMTARSLAA